MRTKYDQFLILPFLGLFLGTGTPLFILGVDLNGTRGGIAAGAFTATSFILFIVCMKIGKNKPELSRWAIKTTTGTTLTIFSTSLICSSVAALLIIVPAPIWFVYIVVSLYMLYAIYYLLQGIK